MLESSPIVETSVDTQASVLLSWKDTCWLIEERSFLFANNATFPAHKPVTWRVTCSPIQEESLSVAHRKIFHVHAVWVLLHKSFLTQDSHVQPVEKPFMCEQCNFSGKGADELKQHKFIHSGEKLCSCAQCNFSCIQSNTLKAHMRTHSGEKPFRCDQCNYSCIQADQLKKPKRNGEKPLFM